MKENLTERMAPVLIVSFMWHLNVKERKTKKTKTSAGEMSLSLLFASFVCLSHPQVSLQLSPPRKHSWIGLERPRRAASGTFGPLSQKSDIPVHLSCLFVIRSTCRQLESRLCRDLRWWLSRATAGPCFLSDLKGAKNRYQICCLDLTRVGGLINAARICCTNTGGAKQRSTQKVVLPIRTPLCKKRDFSSRYTFRCPHLSANVPAQCSSLSNLAFQYFNRQSPWWHPTAAPTLAPRVPRSAEKQIEWEPALIQSPLFN